VRGHRADGQAAPVVSDAATLRVGADVSTFGEFEDAIDGTAAVIRITGDFELDGDVTISRAILITSDDEFTIGAYPASPPFIR